MGSTRIKGYLGNIHRFYQWNSYDHVMFGYCAGMKRALPSMSLTKAIETYLEDFGLCEEVYCFDNAWQAYYRILRSLQLKEMGPIIEEDRNSK